MRKDFPVLKTNILYLILGFILYFAGAYFQIQEIFSGLLMTEYVLIFLPSIMYLLVEGVDLKEYLRLNKISIRQIVYIILIILFAYPLAVLLNAIAMMIISSFTNYIPESVPLPDDFNMYLFSLFVIGLSPGICEEVMFRGVIMRGYESLGRKKAILLSSILFGVFHFNIQNLIGPIFLGIILGILVYKSNSIYSSIIGHSLNNGIAMTIGYIINRSSKLPSEDPLIMGESNVILYSFLIFGFLVLSSIIMVYLIRNFPEEDKIDREEKILVRAKAWEYLPLALIIILFIWVNGRVYFNLF